MAKSIIISEDGTQKAMNEVRKVNVKNASGGSSNWIPEDETSVDTITITKNGEYVASQGGNYGYSRVLVLVPGGGDAEVDGKIIRVPAGGVGSAVTGTIDGVPYRVYVDSDGNLVTEAV